MLVRTGRTPARLALPWEPLTAAISQGVGTGPRMGEVSESVNTALRHQEVALDRAAVRLDDLGAPEQAAALGAPHPRCHSRRASDDALKTEEAETASSPHG